MSDPYVPVKGDRIRRKEWSTHNYMDVMFVGRQSVFGTDRSGNEFTARVEGEWVKVEKPTFDLVDPLIEPRSIDEARLQMVHELHRAVFGRTWARADSRSEVWVSLLARVSDRFPLPLLERRNDRLTVPAMECWANAYPTGELYGWDSRAHADSFARDSRTACLHIWTDANGHYQIDPVAV